MLLILALLIINFLILRDMGKNAKKISGKPGYAVYGTLGCGWTRKQLEYLKSKGISHTFIDCDKGGCEGMEAFPTMITPDGEKIVGFREI